MCFAYRGRFIAATPAAPNSAHRQSPTVNRLLSVLIHLDAFHLHQRDSELVGTPANQHEHFMLTLLFWSDAYHIAFVARL
jgi:hypothetical protein